MNPDSTAAHRTVCTGTPRCTLALFLAHLLLMAAGLLLVQGCATTETVMRGREIRRESRIVREQADFEAALAPAVDGCICLRFNRIALTTTKEWIYYEKWTVHSGRDEKTAPTLVQNEYLEVPGEEKTEPRAAGPLAGEMVQLAGVSVRTDANGMLRDTGEMILGLFDRQKLPADNAEATFPVRHATLGEKTLTLTRRKLLEVLGSPQDEPRLASDEGLQAQVVLDPATPRPGDLVHITLSVENKGKKPVSKVIGRTFSRHPWLTGRNFYIGTVAPESKRVFVRTVQLPATFGSSGETAFASMGIWNRSGNTVAVPLPPIQVAPAPPQP